MEAMDVFDDLAAEDEQLDLILAALDDDAWRSPSGAPGWSIGDVVLHLAQTDEAVVASAGEPTDSTSWRPAGQTVDELVHGQIWIHPALSEVAEQAMLDLVDELDRLA